MVKVSTAKVRARDALEKAGYGKVQVYRAYPPMDEQDPQECLFVTTTGLPKTAWLHIDGRVKVRPGWGPAPKTSSAL